MLNPSSLAFIHQIESLLAANKNEDAQTTFKQHQSKHPNGVETRYIQGLIALTNEETEGALSAFNGIKSNFKNDAKFHNNLGHAHLKLNQVQAAKQAFEQACKIDPQNTQAQYNLACTHIHTEQGHEALLAIEKLLKTDPKNSSYLCIKADALRITRAYKQAIRLYQACLETEPDHVSANSNLGALLVSFGQNEAAYKHAKTAVKLAPQKMLTHLNFGRCLTRLERFDEAMEAFADAYDLEQNSPHLCADIADMWLLSGDSQEASEWYHKALRIQPDFIPASVGLARLMLLVGQTDKALELLENLLQQHPDNNALNLAYADALWDDGDVPAALKAINNVTLDDQQNPNALTKAAQIHASSGDIAGAMNHYQQALDLNPNNVAALNGMAVKQRGQFKHELAERMNHLLNQKTLKEGPQSLLHNGLAYYFHGNKAWEQAAYHMSEANRLQWQALSQRNWDYDRAKHKKYFEQIKTTFNQDYFQNLNTNNNDSEMPVFIVAMPRSGTTLTEQILARHPNVLGIGERNFANQFLTQLSTGNKDSQSALSQLPNAAASALKKLASLYLLKLNTLKSEENKSQITHVVDKMPDNYSNIGWILTLFPKAKIIHCRRDPRDVALSCWMTQFGKIQWASRMDDLIDRIHQYQEMMSHWRKVIPDRFIEINYEDLVTDQEHVSKHMINYLGLNWDEACLKFYESDRIVRTASITQVREPIYTKSVNKWQKYAPYIPELNGIKLPHS